MRIVIVHNRYRSGAPSGENRVVDRESAALAARGHVVERFERSSDAIGDFPVLRKAALALTAMWSGEARRDLVRTLRRVRPDVVHMHNTFPLITASALSACWTEGVPVVITVHNYRLLCASHDLFRMGAPCRSCVGVAVPLPAVVHGCYRGSKAWTLPVAGDMIAHRSAWRTKVAAHIFISDAQRALHEGLRLPPERVFVKWNLVPRVVGPPPGRRRENLVAYLGRLDHSKGIPLLMEAWDRFVSKAPASALHLVIAGGGPLRPVVERWAEGRPSVRVTGMLDAAHCAELVRRARAVVVPSQWEETFGLVVVEAKAAGTAVVASGHGSLPELVDNGVDGVLFPPGDADALARALLDVDDDPGHWERLGAAARLSYERKFDPDENLDDLVRIYRFAVAHPVREMPSPRAPVDASTDVGLVADP